MSWGERVRDGLGRRTLKALAVGLFVANRAPLRLWRRIGGRSTYTLGGACRRSACCCEAPTIQANLLVWHVSWLRRAFLAWQSRVNGFELQRTEEEGRLFVFLCTHFDREARKCDSYHSRPGVCRDYPRALLDQPLPEFFPRCGYRAVRRDARDFVKNLEAHGVTPEQMTRLKRDLYLDE